MTDVLQVEKRERTGSAATRRLRQSGRIPAVLYGHGEATESLSVPSDEVKALLRHHGKTVELAGAIKETAMVCAMQWDPLGIEVLHLDLMRVNLSEKVDVTVSIHVHGDPVGVREGGILLENHHEVEIRCSAGDIPENIGLNVSDLHLGQSLTAGDLELPAGVELVTPADTVVAHVEEPRAMKAEDDSAESASEPDVIAKGGPKDEED
ncbi:50S ribosomal protein L25 [Novipirellula sp.]|uniref:50S ribosomal protein L25 n=1 Tax=Novipirellula sp. TaxID=2795430 RepID=UPI003561C8A8